MATNLKLRLNSTGARVASAATDTLNGTNGGGAALRFPAEIVSRFPTPRHARWKDAAGAARTGPFRLPAPAEAAAAAEEALCSPDLVRQIEATLDRVQRKLGEFKQQLEDSYRFPLDGPHAGPPSARPPFAA